MNDQKKSKYTEEFDKSPESDYKDTIMSKSDIKAIAEATQEMLQSGVFDEGRLLSNIYGATDGRHGKSVRNSSTSFRTKVL